ncbi:MAG: hypothetical protein ACREQP_12055, partial [Candidatus Binatia bacterium]
MKIRWHLMILVAVALLPVLIFAGVMIPVLFGMAVPASMVEPAMRRTLLLASLGAFLLLALGFFLAAVFSGRIAAAFANLSNAAAAMGRGEIPQVPPLPIAEANRLARAFEEAALSRK